MRIDHLTINNFHGIKEADYDLHPKATILLGNNATGKSAILDALAILAGSYFLGIDGVSSLTIKNDDIRQEVRIEKDGSTRRVYHTPTKLSAKGEVHGNSFEWSRERRTLAGKTIQAGAKQIATLAEVNHDDLTRGEKIIRPFLGYYSVARLGAQKKETKNQKMALADLRAGYMNALTEESSQWVAERWFAGLQSRAESGLGEAKPIFEVAKSKLLSLFQRGERPLVDIRHDSEIDEIFVRFDGDDGFIPIHFLSSGFESVLSMGIDIIYRIYILNPHLGANAFEQTPGLALVDETDMHLHPKWQGHIVEDLRDAFPALQFVFTTHSPFVIQSLRQARIIDLDINQVRDVGDHMKKSIPEVAEEFMGMENLERSPYFMEQVSAAEEYFSLLKSASLTDPNELAKEKAKLDSYEIRYNRDPAFIALLRAERNSSILKDN